MKLDGAFLRSRVARRIVFLFVLSALVPVAALALLSYDHLRKLLVDQAMKGAPPSVSAPSLLALLTFAVVAPLAAWPRLRRVVRDERFWGRR